MKVDKIKEDERHDIAKEVSENIRVRFRLFICPKNTQIITKKIRRKLQAIELSFKLRNEGGGD